MRRLGLALAACVASCGDGSITDARWQFSWRVEGDVVTDVWTDRASTCAESAASPENVAALVQKSALAACTRRCREVLECELRCATVIAEVSRRCTAVRRRRPPTPWINLH